MFRADIATHGFVKISNHELDIEKLKIEIQDKSYYTEENIRNRSVYPSDKSETRESNAFMLCPWDSNELPFIQGVGDEIYKAVKQYHSYLDIPFNFRTMVNIQEYMSGSKPVPEHFDGEYFDFYHDDNTLEIKEGLLSDHVGVLVLENHNDGAGVELINWESGEVISPKLGAGDFIIFDNIKFKHRVPELNKPRTMIGFRNFDYWSNYYNVNEVVGSMKPWNNGYLRSESPMEIKSRIKRFNKEWFDSYDHNTSVAF